MPITPNNHMPLPHGWDIGYDYDGKVYFIDHNSKKTTWIDPRDSYTKAQTFADCVGHELPYGWEECCDPQIGLYYVDHRSKKNQIEDPRVQWRLVQENMLAEYLESAETDLASKENRLKVKEQRLALARDQYEQLNRTITEMDTSVSADDLRTVTRKLDPKLLKSDLENAKNRIQQLKRERSDVEQEVVSTKTGLRTLSQVQDKLSQMSDGYTLEEAHVIMSELLNIEELLKAGELEKAELIQSLAKIGEDISPLEEINECSQVEPRKTSIASQTDFAGEAMPLGAQLAELTKLKLKYDSAKSQLKTLQNDLASLEEHLSPTEAQMDRDRLLLMQEKEQLLNEYKFALQHAVSSEHIESIKQQMGLLQRDLSDAMATNNQTIVQRLRLQEDRQALLLKLRTTIRVMVKLEGELRSLSASTLSMSSTSSLGSLSTSSKGSASSLSFTDIYCSQQYASNEQIGFSILQKRVDKLLKSNNESDRLYAEKLRTLEGSMLSLSPRSSLSSLSPPFDPEPVEDLAASIQESLANLSLLPRLDHGILYEEEEHEGPIGVQTGTMSAAVSDESVAGDSGVYEACPKGSDSPDIVETPQIQIELRFKKAEGLLCVGVERGRHLASLMSEPNCKVCVKVQLFPLGGSIFTCCTHSDQDLVQPYFKDNFTFPVSPRRLSTKTIQINVWAVRDTNDVPDEECVGYAQISLADVDLETAQTKWYNILNYALLRPDSLNRDDLSSKSSTLRSNSSNQNVKEESSDESTIISSQTSTLTRSVDPDCVRLNLPSSDDFNNVIDSDDDSSGDHTGEKEEETESVVDRALENAEDTAVEVDLVESFSETADKETNTECLFNPLVSSSVKTPEAKHRLPLIKRSQTFTPSAVVNGPDYACRLNRSGSDSCVSRAPFKRGSAERRSLRWKNRFSSSMRHPQKPSSFTAMKGTRTSLDLELDLAAQNLRLQTLKDEIESLKLLRSQLEEVKTSPEKASLLLEDDGLPSLLSMTSKAKTEKSPEDKKVDKMLRRTSREVQKLRNSKTPRGQPDVTSFKQKMAFFLPSNNAIPSLDFEEELETTIQPTVPFSTPKVFLPEALFDPNEKGVEV